MPLPERETAPLDNSSFTMARTQYIFIDYENASESDLSRVSGKPVRVFMILGNRHKKLPTSLCPPLYSSQRSKTTALAVML